MRNGDEQRGFTVIEIIVAGILLAILCVGILTAYSTVTRLNRGNDIKAQSLTILQREVEEFRSFRFVPGVTDTRLLVGTYPNYKTGVASANGTLFNISVVVDNDPTNSAGTALDAIPEEDCKFKQITITAVLQNPETGWLADLLTTVEIQRVRSN